MIHKIKVPRLGVNEDEVTLVEWFCKEGEWVNTNQPICNVETSKALFEICAEQSGYLRIKVPTKKTVKVQDTIGYITKFIDAPLPQKEDNKPRGKTEGLAESVTRGPRVLATKKARELAAQLGVDLKDIPKKGLIKAEDVKNPKLPSGDRSKEKIKIAIYGAGRGGQVAREYAELTGKYLVACFLDDDPNLIGSSIAGIEVLDGSDPGKLAALGVRKVFSEIANADFRIRLKERLEKAGIEMLNLIHPTAYIAPSAKLGVGNFIKSGAVVDTNTSIGNCCIIDNGVVIAHDNIINDGCHLAPGVTLGSNIIVGEKTIIGIGSCVSTKVIIGKNCIIAVGSSVVQDIPDNSIVEGVPGKIIGSRKNR